MRISTRAKCEVLVQNAKEVLVQNAKYSCKMRITTLVQNANNYSCKMRITTRAKCEVLVQNANNYSCTILGLYSNTRATQYTIPNRMYTNYCSLKRHVGRLHLGSRSGKGERPRRWPGRGAPPRGAPRCSGRR